MNIDNLNEIKKLDDGSVAKSIELLSEQIKEVLEESKTIKIPKEYGTVKQVVISGMGGSNLGAGIVKAVFAGELKVPVSILAGYQVPGNIDKDTLFIMSSYSGTTEETVSTFQEVKKRKAKIMVITAGGDLQKLMDKHKLPGLILKPSYNPSGQPRLGLGYSIFGMSMLLAKTGLLKLEQKTIRKVIEDLEFNNRKFVPETRSSINPAKKIAKKIYGKSPVIVGAEFLTGNLRILRNQFCETSKSFASYLIIPDMNHFAMEGLSHPKSNKDNFIFLFFDSKLYHPRIQVRSKLTKQIVKKNKIEVIDIELASETKLEQAFEMLQFATWITYYLGLLNEAHPVEVPFVDWFKKELKKHGN